MNDEETGGATDAKDKTPPANSAEATVPPDLEVVANSTSEQLHTNRDTVEKHYEDIAQSVPEPTPGTLEYAELQRVQAQANLDAKARAEAEVQDLSLEDLSEQQWRDELNYESTPEGPEKEKAQQKAQWSNVLLQTKIQEEMREVEHLEAEAEKLKDSFKDAYQEVRQDFSDDRFSNFLYTHGRYGPPEDEPTEDEIEAGVKEKFPDLYRQLSILTAAEDRRQAIEREVEAGRNKVFMEVGTGDPQVVGEASQEDLEEAVRIAQENVETTQAELEAGTGPTNAAEALQVAQREKAQADANLELKEKIAKKSPTQLSLENEVNLQKLKTLCVNGASEQEIAAAEAEYKKSSAALSAKERQFLQKPREDAINAYNILKNNPKLTKENTEQSAYLPECKERLQAAKKDWDSKVEMGRKMGSGEPLDPDLDQVDNSSIDELSTEAETKLQTVQDAQKALMAARGTEGEEDAQEDYFKACQAANQATVNLHTKIAQDPELSDWREKLEDKSFAELQEMRSTFSRKTRDGQAVDQSNPAYLLLMGSHDKQIEVISSVIVERQKDALDGLKRANDYPYPAVVTNSVYWETPQQQQEVLAYYGVQTQLEEAMRVEQEMPNAAIAIHDLDQAYEDGGVDELAVELQHLDETLTPSEAQYIVQYLNGKGRIEELTTSAKCVSGFEDNHYDSENGGYNGPIISPGSNDKDYQERSRDYETYGPHPPEDRLDQAVNVVSGLGHLTYLAKDEASTELVAQSLATPIKMPSVNGEYVELFLGSKGMPFGAWDSLSDIHHSNTYEAMMSACDNIALGDHKAAGLRQGLGLLAVTSQKATENGATFLGGTLEQTVANCSAKIAENVGEKKQNIINVKDDLNAKSAGAASYLNTPANGDHTYAAQMAIETLTKADPDWLKKHNQAEIDFNNNSSAYFEVYESLAYLDADENEAVRGAQENLKGAFPTAAASTYGQEYLLNDVQALGDEDDDTFSLMGALLKNGAANRDKDFGNFLGHIIVERASEGLLRHHIAQNAVLPAQLGEVQGDNQSGEMVPESYITALKKANSFAILSPKLVPVVEKFTGAMGELVKMMANGRKGGDALIHANEATTEFLEGAAKLIYGREDDGSFAFKYNRVMVTLKTAGVVGALRAFATNQDFMTFGYAAAGITAYVGESKHAQDFLAARLGSVVMKDLKDWAPIMGTYTTVFLDFFQALDEFANNDDPFAGALRSVITGAGLYSLAKILAKRAAIGTLAGGAGGPFGAVAGGVVGAVSFSADIILQMHMTGKDEKEIEDAGRRILEQQFEAQLKDPRTAEHTEEMIDILLGERLLVGTLSKDPFGFESAAQKYPLIRLNRFYSTLHNNGWTKDTPEEFLEKLVALEPDELRDLIQMCKDVELENGQFPLEHTLDDKIIPGSRIIMGSGKSNRWPAGKVPSYIANQIPNYNDQQIVIKLTNPDGSTYYVQCDEDELSQKQQLILETKYVYDIPTLLPLTPVSPFPPNSATGVVKFMEAKGIDIGASPPSDLPSGAQATGATRGNTIAEYDADSRYYSALPNPGEDLFALCKREHLDYATVLKFNTQLGHISDMNALTAEDVIYVPLEAA